jgi:hypothetical protein
VTFRGKRVFKQAHMPLLNVRYEQDACGPYRDWLWEETCFEAVGQDVPGAPGFRWCTQPPQTILDSGQDGGNFTGVAVWEASDGSLRMVTQCSAGWYRYIMEWRFYEDGRILPRFRFAGVANSCVCEAHNHHAFWRLDFDIIDRQNTIEEWTGTDWKQVKKEFTRFRQAGQDQRWRVLHRSGAGYEIIPGPDDGQGDTFSGPDFYALRWHRKELDDQKQGVVFNAQSSLQKFVRQESIKKQDLVIWYLAHFRHVVDDQGETHEDDLGPTLQPINWPS